MVCRNAAIVLGITLALVLPGCSLLQSIEPIAEEAAIGAAAATADAAVDQALIEAEGGEADWDLLWGAAITGGLIGAWKGFQKLKGRKTDG